MLVGGAHWWSPMRSDIVQHCPDLSPLVISIHHLINFLLDYSRIQIKPLLKMNKPSRTWDVSRLFFFLKTKYFLSEFLKKFVTFLKYIFYHLYSNWWKIHHFNKNRMVSLILLENIFSLLRWMKYWIPTKQLL